MTNLKEASDRATKEMVKPVINMSKSAAQRLMEDLMGVDPRIRAFFHRRMPNYRYFSIRKVGEDRYFWTTETVKHGGKPRYASGIYRYLKTKKAFKLVNERYHVKRKDAKARALKLWEERKD